jgi:hypothetical protein
MTQATQVHTLPSGALVRPLVPQSKPKQDDELEVLKTKVSLNDIVSKQRIQLGVKSTRCKHHEAFDFYSFCKVNGVLENFFSKLSITDADNRWSIRDIPNDEHLQFQMTLKPGKVKEMTGHLKLTRKWKHVLEFKCPVCNVHFTSQELIHDDFISSILNKVDESVDAVEIDDGLICTVLKETTPYDSKEVISLSDDEDEHHSKRRKVKVHLFSDDEEFDVSDSDEYEEVNGGTEDDPVIID